MPRRKKQTENDDTAVLAFRVTNETSAGLRDMIRQHFEKNATDFLTAIYEKMRDDAEFLRTMQKIYAEYEIKKMQKKLAELDSSRK